MDIKYTDKHDFNKNELEELFLSVNWSSGHYPEKLCVAMKNFNTVFSAYDKEMHFYQNCGFEKSNDASPMFITSLWT